MDLRLVLDVIAIASALFSAAFWFSSQYVYKDIQTEIRNIRQEMIMLLETKALSLFSKSEKQVQRNAGKIVSIEARLLYLEEILVKDESYSVFIEKLILLQNQNSDFT